MMSDGLAETPLKAMRYVFCHILPKPCRGPLTSFPSTFKFNAPLGTLETLSPVTWVDQKAASRGCSSGCPFVGLGEVDIAFFLLTGGSYQPVSYPALTA